MHHDSQKGTGVRQKREIILVVLGLLVFRVVPLADALETADSYVERGYRLLAQAHLETREDAREQLLTAAVEAFKEGYQRIGQTTQVQALLGAAQSYLLMRTPHRVFPFLWQATPLQRAEKSLQQILVLQPDNAAATLLLGMIYWRQATASTPPRGQHLTHSTAYLERAAALGIPVQPPTASAAPDRRPTFSVHDTLLLLRYVDARGTGTMADLVLIYRTRAAGVCFGVVVAAGRAYPLMTNPTTGTMIPTAAFETLAVDPQPEAQPLLTIHARQGTQPLQRRFVWDGTRFVYLP